MQPGIWVKFKAVYVFGSVAYVIDDCPVPAAGRLLEQQDVDSIAPEVQAILRDDTGISEAQASLCDLPATGFQQAVLDSVLAPPETFDEWRVGEALAELCLTKTKDCSFPWPDSRSTRNPNSSQGGIDLVGFQFGEKVRFAFAEVKTSHQQAWPPSVLTSRSHGLHSQLIGLEEGDNRSRWAIKYLALNGAGRTWFSHFRSAMANYLADQEEVALYGVLVHVSEPNVADLKKGATKLAAVASRPARMELVAIYLGKELLAKVADGSVLIETAA